MTTRWARVVDRWASTYTSGLPDDVVDQRRAELASDVWEQLHDPDHASSLGIATRLVRGIPADLVWRVETRYHLGGLMHGTLIVALRIAATLVSGVAAAVLLWGLVWTAPGIVAAAVVLGALAAGLWWVSATPASRERNRRLAIGGAVASTCVVVVMALVVSGVS